MPSSRAIAAPWSSGLPCSLTIAAAPPIRSASAGVTARVELDLAHPPSDRCALDRANRAAQVGEDLVEADHAPAQRPVDLPVVELFVGEVRPACGDVRLAERRDGSEAADAVMDAPEAPRVHAAPAEVLGGAAEVTQLPVEHGADSVGVDKELSLIHISEPTRPY